MSYFLNSWHCKELLMGINNKIGSYKLYVLYVHFHLNVFSTQVRVSPYILKWERENTEISWYSRWAIDGGSVGSSRIFCPSLGTTR
jgi:hypothetical protein